MPGAAATHSLCPALGSPGSGVQARVSDSHPVINVSFTEVTAALGTAVLGHGQPQPPQSPL